MYISFDIDVFDSSVVKATGYPSENGFTEIEGISILNDILKINKPIIFDLVEINPEKGNPNKTTSIARNIIKELVE